MSKIEIINEENLNENLSSLANTIKLKNSISNNLNFPSDFISEINNFYVTNDWFDLNKPVGKIYTTRGFISPGTLNARKKITKLFASNATGIDANALTNCTSLTHIVLPKGVVLYSGACSSNTKLTTVDLGGTPTSAQGLIRSTTFSGCTVFNTLILRANTVWTLSYIAAFTNTPFASGKAGGTLYVPRAQIENYKNATNWSTILGYTKSDGETLQNKILPIEDSIYQAQYGDGTPLPGAFVSSTGKAYMPTMRIDTGGKTIINALSPYGDMENLEELTLIGNAKNKGVNNVLIYSQEKLFTTTKYPLLKKLYIQPSSLTPLNNETADYFKFGHYCFSQTNLTDLVLGQVGGPYFANGGYFRDGDMPCPPGTNKNQTGSLDGLTITVYIDPSNTYANRAGFINSTLAPNTTLICKDYTTGETFTPS